MKPIVLQPRHIKRLQEHGSCQARFPVDPQPPSHAEEVFDWNDSLVPKNAPRTDIGLYYHDKRGLHFHSHYPFENGETLFVQEEWKCIDGQKDVEDGATVYDPDRVYYRASPGVVSYHDHYSYKRVDGPTESPCEIAEEMDHEEEDWRPASSMPEWASRFRVRVKKLWVEQLQKTSEEGAVAEGFTHCCNGADCVCDGEAAKGEFSDVWTQENPSHPWTENIWVWVPELEMEGRRS